MGKTTKQKKSKSYKPKKSRSLVDALFTSTQQKVFRLLFSQPDRKFIAQEIITLAKAGTGAIQRELAALSASGLVTLEKSGKQKYYQANKDSPIFEELFQITLKTIGLTEPIRNALISIRSPIQLAFIFGSVAKGTAKAGSDVDVLVVSDDLSQDDLYHAFEPTERLLSRKISPTLYSTSEFAERVKMKNPFLEKVMAGEKIILIGNENGVTA